jgi:hypothetical protein
MQQASVADTRNASLAGRAAYTTVPAVLRVAGRIDAGIHGKGHIRRIEGRGAVLHGRCRALACSGNACAGTAPDPACAATILVRLKVNAESNAGSDLAGRVTLTARLGVPGPQASAGLLLAGGQAEGEKNDREPTSNPSIRAHTHPPCPSVSEQRGTRVRAISGRTPCGPLCALGTSQFPRLPSSIGLDQCGLMRGSFEPGPADARRGAFALPGRSLPNVGRPSPHAPAWFTRRGRPMRPSLQRLPPSRRRRTLRRKGNPSQRARRAA